MNSHPSHPHARHTQPASARRPRARPVVSGVRRTTVAVGAFFGIAALTSVFVLAPNVQASRADQLAAYIDAHTQTFGSGTAPASTAARDAYSATPGVQALKAGGTNRDWAKLVLLYGGWPQSDNNVTVILRWMRQENYPPSWWLRNNPLNNGYGSGGNSGLGSFSSLDQAAKMVAATLHNNTGSGFSAIAASFAASAPTADTEALIWSAGWSASHYAGGTHWSTADVQIVQAPASAWG